MSSVVLDYDWFPEPVPDNVILGEGSWLWSAYAFLHYRSTRPVGVEIGSHTGIYETTFFGLGPRGEVKVGDYCTIVGVTFCTNGRVEVGDHSFISKPVTIADRQVAVPLLDFEDGGAEPNLAVLIGENVWIGANTVLLAGARIGEGAVVGASTVVSDEVPPYAVVAGDPMRVIGWARPASEQGAAS